jgi:transposase InsO family protein
MIIGWAMDDNYKTPLITSAVTMAARNVNLPEGAIFHSDRGTSYTSAEYAKELKELKIRQSVGRTGICYDNAMAESVNGTLKVELVHRKVYTTRRQAMDDIARWIELRYNQTRLHSTLGYRTRERSWTSFWEWRRPRKLTGNSLFGKRGAAQAWAGPPGGGAP